MLDPQLLAALQRLPLFAGMPQQRLEAIARVSRVTRFDPGAVVFRQWEIARGFYMLLGGSGQLIQEGDDGGQRLLANVVAGQFFNEAALTTEIVEQASFVITAPSLVLHIARADYHRAMAAPIPAAAAPPPGRIEPPPRQPQPASGTAAVPPRPPAGIRSPHLSAAAGQSGPRTAHDRGPRPKWLNPGEVILLQTRRHWWAAVRRLWLPVLIFAGIMLAALLIDSPFATIVLSGFALLVPGGLIVYLIFDWRNDWLVITDERVLRVEQVVARFSVHTQEVGLLSVQGVASNFPPGDPAARVLRYGNVVISTAGSAGNITMDFVPNPSRIKDYVFRQREIMVRAAENANGNFPQTPDSQPPVAPDGRVREPNTFPSDGEGRRNTASVRGGGLFTMRYINENGDIVYRRHLIVWARHIFWPLLAFTAAGLFLLFGRAVAAFRDAGVLPVVIGVVGMILSLIWLYLADWDWRNDLYIIGRDVVTLLHRSPLLLQFREDQVLIQRIHNIEAETTGLLRSLLDYGDVRVLLLGDETPKVFKDVPGPVGVREEISRRQREAAETAREAEEKRQLDAVVARMEEQGRLPAAGAAGLPNPAAQQPAPGQLQADFRPPVQPQRPPIPRRRV